MSCIVSTSCTRSHIVITEQNNLIYYIPSVKLPLVFSEIVFISLRVKCFTSDDMTFSYVTSDDMAFAVTSTKLCQHPIKLQKNVWFCVA